MVHMALHELSYFALLSYTFSTEWRKPLNRVIPFILFRISNTRIRVQGLFVILSWPQLLSILLILLLILYCTVLIIHDVSSLIHSRIYAFIAYSLCLTAIAIMAAGNPLKHRFIAFAPIVKEIPALVAGHPQYRASPGMR